MKIKKHYEVFTTQKFYFQIELITESKQFRKVIWQDLHRSCHKQGYMKAGSSLGASTHLCWHSLRLNWYGVGIQIFRETTYETCKEHTSSYCGKNRSKQGIFSFTKRRTSELLTNIENKKRKSHRESQGAGKKTKVFLCLSCWVGKDLYREGSWTVLENRSLTWHCLS